MNTIVTAILLLIFRIVLLHGADFTFTQLTATGQTKVFSLDGKYTIFLDSLYEPSINPQKEILATTIVENNNRFIMILDIKTGKREVLKNVRSTNSYGPELSPDASLVVYNTYINGNWSIGIYNIIKKKETIIHATKPYYQPTWSVDGNFVYAHNMVDIYRFDSFGNYMIVFNLEKIFGEWFPDMTSGTKYYFFGESIITNVAVRDPDAKGYSYTGYALVEYDLHRNISRQITSYYDAVEIKQIDYPAGTILLSVIDQKWNISYMYYNTTTRQFERNGDQ